MVIVLAIVAAVLVGCGSDPLTRTGRPTTLVGSAWRAVTVNGRAPVIGREPTIVFAATRVSGSGGCNQFGGAYTYDGSSGQIQFTEVAMTAMGCDAAIGGIEGVFSQALVASDSASIDETGRLVLSGPASQIVLAVDAQPIGTA